MTEAQYKEKAEKILRALSTTHNQVEFLLELRKQDIEEILGEDEESIYPKITAMDTAEELAVKAPLTYADGFIRARNAFRKEVKERAGI